MPGGALGTGNSFSLQPRDARKKGTLTSQAPTLISWRDPMAVFDLLLDYVVRADCSHLRAREYGLLLSSLVVDRQSRASLADALRRAEQTWRKQKGYQHYLDISNAAAWESASLSAWVADHHSTLPR